MEQNKRISRVEREIREIAAQFIIRGLVEKPSGLLTVSRVWVSKDLRIARVYFTVLGGTQSPQEVEDILQESLSEMQRQVASQMTTKYCPKLEIYHDDSYDKAMHVQNLIRQVVVDTKANGEDDKKKDDTNE